MLATITYDCVDGEGETSYFPKESYITDQNYHSTLTPQEIVDSRVAYMKHKCSRITYYINKSENFKKTSESKFYEFIEEYNQTCKCLERYFAGCC